MSMDDNVDLMGLFKDSEPLTERQLYELSKSLFDKKKLLMISDLDKNSSEFISKLRILDNVFARKYCKDSKLLHRIESDMLQLTISKSRQGRREIIEMFKRMDEKRKEEGAKKGLFKR